MQQRARAQRRCLTATSMEVSAKYVCITLDKDGRVSAVSTAVKCCKYLPRYMLGKYENQHAFGGSGSVFAQQ